MIKTLIYLIPKRWLVAIALAFIDWIVEKTPTKLDDKIWKAIRASYESLKELAEEFGEPDHKSKIADILQSKRT